MSRETDFSEADIGCILINKNNCSKNCGQVPEITAVKCSNLSFIQDSINYSTLIL